MEKLTYFCLPLTAAHVSMMARKRALCSRPCRTRLQTMMAPEFTCKGGQQTTQRTFAREREIMVRD